ncbi:MULTISPECIES: S1 family peptidase [Natrialbaceae]|uniref:S1 family peptidase n=1 Tax=Natrialbaceae TaxID=1644061 RepID=UPI00207D3ECD|nr:S1 family peptidase [Natronococcus sp. CG52]
MPTTRDFEYLLECRNVIGVDYDEREDRVRVFVSRKLPPGALDDEDDVEKRITEVETDADVTVDVVDAGYDEDRDGYDALSILEPAPEALEDRGDRHRPVPAGVSEINANSTAGTGGPYPARIANEPGEDADETTDDASEAVWSDVAEPGDLVRLSNNHVYARSNEADFGEPVLQPAPHDGGGHDDEVGDLVGYVPIEDGVRVDVAARSVELERESATYYGLEEEWPTDVRRDDYDELRGETVTKTGRTTGVTSATVESTSASVSVEFGGEHGTVTLREQLIAGHMSEGGDSGSAVFLEDGALVGLLFAGSAEQTICNRIANVERELGVEILTGEPDEDDGDDERDAPVYTTTFEHSVEVDLEGPALELESVTFEDQPRPGRRVAATVVVAASEPGSYWLDIDDERRRFEVEPDDDPGRARDGVRRSVEVVVDVPDDSSDTIDVAIAGGRIE